MTKKKRDTERERLGGVEGFLKGFTDIVETLGELAEKGEQFSRSGEFLGKDKNLKGVYGVSVKFGLGDQGVKVEPFGNIRKDETTGHSVVQEIREPIVDVFEEADHILLVAEMPGIGADDIRLDIKDDLLTIYAEKEDKKYRKEVLLPGRYTKEKMLVTCNNGIVEIKCIK